MSLFSPTRIDAIPSVKRVELLTAVTAPNTVKINVEAAKDLTLIVRNAGSAADYGATVSVTAEDFAHNAGNWMYGSIGGYWSSEVASNVISLKRGETRLTIPAAAMAKYSALSIAVSANAPNPVTLWMSWADAADTTVYDGMGVRVTQHTSGVKYFAALEEWTASLDTSDVLTVSNGVQTYGIALTALPSWIAGDSIDTMGFIPYKQGGPGADRYSRETAMRLCFWTRKGNIYHNYAATNAADTAVAGMVDFDLSAIYEPIHQISTYSPISSIRIPSQNASLTTEQQKLYRYDPGLPAWNYTQHSAAIGGMKADGITAYGSGGLPATLDRDDVRFVRLVHPMPAGTNPQNAAFPYQMSGHLCSPFAVHPKCTIYTPYNGLNASKNVILGTIDGGRIWVVMHEIGGDTSTAGHGNSYDLSGFGAYTSGHLSVVRRIYNNPTNAVKEPASAFTYQAPITIIGVSTAGGKLVMTAATAHGFADTNLICFKDNSSGASPYAFLANTITAGQSAAVDSNSAGDGRFYRVKKVSSTQFEVLQCYSGVDEKIACHHIHAANACHDGAIISCGETWPYGWFFFEPIVDTDDFETFDLFRHRINYPNVMRLNSGTTSLQRAVGVLWLDDADQTLIFASDEPTLNRGQVTIPGRTTLIPSRNSAGIYRTKLADVDDLSKMVGICDMAEASLGIINAQGVTVVLGMSRYLYVTADMTNWLKLPVVKNLAVKYCGETPGAVYVLSQAQQRVYRIARK